MQQLDSIEQELDYRGDPRATGYSFFERCGQAPRRLGLDPLKVKREVRKILSRNQSPWKVMGVKKIWNHWLVRMMVFAPYYRKNLISSVRSIDKNWDSNTLLNQKGIFYLTKVCKLIPFSTHQIRYQAKKNPRSREEYGVWKDEELNLFVVDMERFAPWIKILWAGYRQ